MMTAAEISRALADRVLDLAMDLLPGGHREGRHEWRAGSIAGEAGSSLGVHLSGHKAGVWSDFATGECGDALDLVRAALGIGRAEALQWARRWLRIDECDAWVPSRPAPVAPTGERIAWARRLWDRAHGASDSPVEHYLAGRGLSLSPPPSLRWAPRCWHREARASLPAMIAKVVNVDTELIGVHRTYLTPDWRRRHRAALGPTAGGAVRLAEPQPGEWLVIAEGIETTLSVMQATGLPGWAALSAGGIARLVLPTAIERVLICADNDRNGAGGHAARAAAQRWLVEEREVRVAVPPEQGHDFNDMLLRGELNG
jgi:phage/plasmid primase-like uncharacterized protein